MNRRINNRILSGCQIEIQNPEQCDATDDAHSTTAGYHTCIFIIFTAAQKLQEDLCQRFNNISFCVLQSLISIRTF